MLPNITTALPNLTTALRALVAEGTLTEAQAARTAEVLREASEPAPAPAPPQRAGRWSEIAGYLGAALLLAAMALFLTGAWVDLSTTARTTVLVAIGAVLAAAGLFVARSAQVSLHELGQQVASARRRLVSVLWTSASAAASGAAAVAATSAEPAWAGAVGLAGAAVGYALVPGVIGQLGAGAASITLALGLVDVLQPAAEGTTYAVVLVVLGAAWAVLGLRGVVRDGEVALATGAGLALVGAQLPIIAGGLSWLGYLLTALVAVAGFVGYLGTRSFSVLAAGILATTFVVPEALHDWTDGSLSAAGSLLVAGLTLLAASAGGLRLRQEVS